MLLLGQCGNARALCAKELLPYISDGQYRNANLSIGEKKTYNCTFQGGRNYKITTALNNKKGFVRWKLISLSGAILYDSKKSDYKSSLKLKFNSTSVFKIEMSLPDEKQKGCAVLLIGFDVSDIK